MAIITSKYESQCPSCSKRIEIGAKVHWIKGEPALHVGCHRATALAVPTCHLNGTSGPQLVGALRDAAVATRHALDALRACAPHGRDYYLQESAEYDRARRQHDARMMRLHDTLDDLTKIAMAIQLQPGYRERVRPMTPAPVSAYYDLSGQYQAPVEAPVEAPATSPSTDIDGCPF